MIEKTTAVVYRGGGRRYLTLNAACVNEARVKLRAKCRAEIMCDYVDHEGYGRQSLPCQYHDGSEYAQKVLRRLAAIYKRAYLGAPSNMEKP